MMVHCKAIQNKVFDLTTNIGGLIAYNYEKRYQSKAIKISLQQIIMEEIDN